MNDDLERYERTVDEYRHAMKKFSVRDVRVGSTLSFGVFYASKCDHGQEGHIHRIGKTYGELFQDTVIHDNIKALQAVFRHGSP